MPRVVSASTTCVTWSIAHFIDVMRSNNPLGMISSHFSPAWSVPAECGADQLQCGMELWDALWDPLPPQLSSCLCPGLFLIPCPHCAVPALCLAPCLPGPSLGQEGHCSCTAILIASLALRSSPDTGMCGEILYFPYYPTYPQFLRKVLYSFLIES